MQELGAPNPVTDWVSDSCWQSVCALAGKIEEYQHLPDDLVGSAKRWREWMELERPEDEPLPGGVLVYMFAAWHKGAGVIVPLSRMRRRRTKSTVHIDRQGGN